MRRRKPYTRAEPALPLSGVGVQDTECSLVFDLIRFGGGFLPSSRKAPPKKHIFYDIMPKETLARSRGGVFPFFFLPPSFPNLGGSSYAE